MPFNVGDRVRYLTEEDFVPVGSIGTVEVSRENLIRVSFEGVNNPDGLEGWGVCEDELELVEDTMFEIGDRVIGRGIMDGENIDGLVGTVVLPGNEYDASSIGVRFDESRYSFHSLEQNVEEGHGFWVSQSNLEKIDPKRKKERKRRGFATFVRKIENTVDNVS